MGETVEQQMIAQLKKLQERVVALESEAGDSSISDDLKTQINDLKSEVDEFLKSKTKKLDFGEW